MAWLVHWRTFGTLELGQDGFMSVDLGYGSLVSMLAATANDVHPPLFFGVLHLWFGAAGLTSIGAKFVPVAAATATLAVMYAIGKRLASPVAALLAVALFGVSYADLFLAPTVRPFTMSLFCSLLTLLLTLRVLRLPARRGPTLVLLGASTALALLSWYLQPFFVVLEGLLVWRDQRRASPARAGRWRSSTLALLVGALLALPWYIYALPRLLGKMGQGFDVNGNAPGVPALADVASQLMTAVIGRNDGWFYAVGLAGWLVALVLAAGLALWRGRVLAVQGIRWGPLDARGRAIVLVGGVVLGGVEVAVILARWQHPDAAGRYLIAIVPLIALLQAWAIVEGPQVARWVVAAGAGLAVAGQLSWFVPLARGAPIDWAHNPVLQYVAGVAQPGDALLFSDHAQRAQYLLNPLYNGGWPAWLVQTSGDTFLRDSPVQAGQTVRALVRSTSRVWYLESSEWPDAPRLGRDALISNAYFVSGRQVGDTNVQLFLTGQPDQRVALHDVLGGKIALIQAGYSTMAHPGGDMLVDLMWQSLQQTDVSYHVFVHIDDARDQTRAQHDGTPADGTMTTDHWHAGQVVDDRYGIVLPTSLLPGSYHVSVGLYAASGQRLPLPDGANSITLGELVVSG